MNNFLLTLIFGIVFMVITSGQSTNQKKRTQSVSQKTIASEIVNTTIEGTATFSISILCNGKECAKISADKGLASGKFSNGIAIFFRGNGNAVALWTTSLISANGAMSGDYKFSPHAKFTGDGKPAAEGRNGEAGLVLYLLPELGGNVSGLTEGMLHLTVEDKICSGSFDAKGAVKGTAYEVSGSFKNIPLQEKFK